MLGIMAEDKNKKPDEDSLEGASSIIQPTESKQSEKDSVSVASDDQLLDSGSAGNTDSPPPKKPPFFRHIFRSSNLYFVIFLLLLLIAAGAIFASVKLSNKNSPSQNTKTQSLTDKQIADLKGNTTLVGDAQQTLDIQGNSVFEGAVLMRGSLDVAGSIKVGGSLSLPAITVGGTSSFGQIQVNDKLSVSGNTTMQGTLTVQKGLTVSGTASFGTLSASQLNVSTLQLTGDFVVSRHIGGSGGAPGRSNGSALGSGGTASVNGSDTAGTVTINTGGSPPAGCFATINFRQKFNTTPHVVISPSNSSAGLLSYYTNRSSTSFSICTADAPSASTTYLFDYIAID
jgi:cytoskeletal protein CcmA (bactofilin family)